MWRVKMVVAEAASDFAGNRWCRRSRGEAADVLVEIAVSTKKLVGKRGGLGGGGARPYRPWSLA